MRDYILRIWQDNPCIFTGVKAGIPAVAATLWGVQGLPPSIGIPIALGISSLFTWLAVRERSRPNVITAQSNASINQITEMARVFAEVSKEKDSVNHEQTKFWREQHAWAQKKETLIRVTKHNVQDAYGEACNFIQDYEEICGLPIVKAAIEEAGERVLPKYRQRRFREIVGNEDRKMIEELFNDHLKS